MVYEVRYLARNCELKTMLGDIVSHLRHLSHLPQDKTKLLFSFFLILFNYAIQGKFITWLVNSALNCTWKPISHSSLHDSCNIGFCVQFKAEFPRQVMNFPIERTLSPFLHVKPLMTAIRAISFLIVLYVILLSYFRKYMNMYRNIFHSKIARVQNKWRTNPTSFEFEIKGQFEWPIRFK